MLSLTQMRTELQLDDLTRMDQLPALVAEWSDLWAVCPDATPFQLPDWLLPWWSRYAPGELWIVTLRRGGALIGVCPMFIHEERAGRKLMLLGTGISDHLDALIAPPFERVGAAAILRHVARHADRWDICDLQELPAGAAMLDGAAPTELVDDARQQDVCPLLHLPDRVDRLDRVIPERHYQNLQYYRRRLQRQGQVAFEQADERSFETLFDALLRLHTARWQSRGAGGVLGEDAMQQFHREAAWLMLRRGVLRLHAMSIDGRIAACFYGFHHRRRTSYYLGGFDPAFSRLNVGTVMVGHAIERAVEDGAEEFDFLRGSEPYKYAWGAVDRPNFQRVLTPQTSHSRSEG